MTSGALSINSRFPRCALHRSSLQASSRYRPIARDRRGSLLGRSSVIIQAVFFVPGSPPSAYLS
jgi:hypothetical protein